MMTAFVLGLIVVGFLINTVGAIMVLIAAFRTSVWWGLGSIFLPFIGLLFLVTHWEDCKPGVKLEFLGVSFVLLGMVIGFKTGSSSISPPDFAETGVATEAEAVEETGAGSFIAKLREKPEPVEQIPEEVEEFEANQSGPHKYVGMSVDEAKQLLGKPRGELLTGNRIVLDYPRVQLISDDGKTITMEKPRHP